MIFIKEKLTDKKSVLSVILLFIIIYGGFSISGTDLRFPLLITCAFLFLLTIKTIYIPIEILKVLMFLLSLSLYSLLVSTFAQTDDYFETFRYFRCFFTTIVILLFIWKFEVGPQKMMRILSFLLLLNAISIIVGIVWPDFKSIILPISRYSKFFSPYRSSGLLNGQDAAGFFITFGLVLETIKNAYQKKNFLTIPVLIYAISSVFASRFTIAFVTLVFIIDFIISFRNHYYKQAIILFLILIPMLFVAVVFWIMTTNVAIELRYPIVNTMPSLGPLFIDLSESYTDYGVHTSAISNHTHITDLHPFEIVFGAGYRTGVRQDVGYIKTIYAIGFLGIFAQFLFYLKSVKQILQFCYHKVCDKYISVCYFVMVLLMFVWEFKQSFVFSTGFFELLMCIYISCLYSKTIKSRMFILK